MNNQTNTETDIKTVSEEQINAIADQLSNNEFDSDSVLKLFLVNEIGVPDKIAYQAVKLRNTFLVNPLADLAFVNGKLEITNI